MHPDRGSPDSGRSRGVAPVPGEDRREGEGQHGGLRHGKDPHRKDPSPQQRSAEDKSK